MKTNKQMCGNCLCYHCDSFVPMLAKYQQLSLFPKTQQYFTPVKNNEQKINETIIKITNASKYINDVKNPQLQLSTTRPNSDYLESTRQSGKLHPQRNKSYQKYSYLSPHPQQTTRQNRSKSIYQQPTVGNVTTLISKTIIQPSPIINKQYVSSLMEEYNRRSYQINNNSTMQKIVPKIKPSIISQIGHNNYMQDIHSEHIFKNKERPKSINLKQSKEKQKAFLLTNKNNKSFQTPSKSDVCKKIKIKIDHCTLKDNRCLGIDLIVDKTQQIVLDDNGHIYERLTN